MDRVLYVAMNGADQALMAMGIHANNLANANTSGFRADLASYSTVAIEGPGFDSRAYAIAQNPVADYSPGAIIGTGRDLDVAVQGDGLIAVQSEDGRESYTRNGELQIAPNGFLMNNTGDFVIGNSGIIIIPPAEKIDIAGDGTITIHPLGQGAESLAVIDRIKLVNPDKNQMSKGSDGLFHPVNGIPFDVDSDVKLVGKSVESSNVNIVSEMTHIIDLARQFEVQVKLMEASKKDDQKASEMMQM